MFNLLINTSLFLHNSMSFMRRQYSPKIYHVGLIFPLFLLSLNASAQVGGGPSPVKVASVQSVMMAPLRQIPANVQAKFTTSIKAESKGIVNSLAEIGSLVKQGKVLAELIDTQSKLREQELKDAVKSNRAQYDFLKSENSRLTDLLNKKLISNSELEKNQSDYLSAKGDFNQSQSRLKQYQDQVTKLTILAPFDGYVTQQFAQPGQLLDSGDAVVEFMQADNLEVVVNVPFKYKSQIKIGTSWDVHNTNGDINAAEISQFIPAATGNSHTIEVHLSIYNNGLWPGESVTVMVPTQTPQKVIAVPRDALVIRKSGSYIFTVVENKSHQVDVITGMAEGDLIEVKGLLSVGDSVIIRGNERLSNDQEIKIIE